MSRAKVKDGLTLQELRFVEAYMGAAEGNATRAAELAGYKHSSRDQLHDIARRLVKKPHVKAALEKRADADPLVMTRQDLQVWWSQVVRGEPFEQLVEGAKRIAPMPPPTRARVSEFLAKSLRMFGDEPKGNAGMNVVIVQLPDNGRDAPIVIDGSVLEQTDEGAAAVLPAPKKPARKRARGGGSK